MGFTGGLGSADSKLANIELGIVDTGGGSGGLTQIVTQSIVFTQSAIATSIDTGAVTNTLSFSQTATATRNIRRTVSDVLSLTDVAIGTDSSIHVNVVQSLAFTQVAQPSGAIRVGVIQTMNLVQNDEGHAGVSNKSQFDIMFFKDAAGRTVSMSVAHTLSLVDTAERRNSITQALALSQSVHVGKGGAASDILALVQVAGLKLVLRRTLADNLGLFQSVTYVVDNNCIKKSYRPFVGSSTDSTYTPPSTTAPTLSRGLLTLTFPYVTPTNTLILRNPDFGNKERLVFNRIVRETRGGTLVVFADPKWPKTQVLSFQVSGLRAQALSDFRDFILASLGQEIGLLDQESRQWRGYITNPEAPLSQPERSGRVINIDFQGVLA